MADGFETVDEYYDLCTRDLPHLFGARAALVSAAQRHITLRPTPQRSRLRLPGGTHVLELTRPAPAFFPDEMRLLAAYGLALRDLAEVPRAFVRTASADVLTRAIAVRCSVDRPERATELEQTIRLIAEQAAKTYEGQRVAVNVCMDLQSDIPGEALSEFFKAPWAAVLGSGLTTAVRVNGAGDVTAATSLTEHGDDDLLAPERFLPLAAWANEPARVALAATRTGEIYVLSSGRIQFAQRNALWRGFPTDALMEAGWFATQVGLSRATKRAALVSLIDASAAHHGACLGMVRPNQVAAVRTTLVAPSDRWDAPDNLRRRIFNADKITDLARRQRLEMLSMDGATLVTSAGDHRCRRHP